MKPPEVKFDSAELTPRAIPYVPLSDILTQNGERFVTKAEAYFARGDHRAAVNCLRKAKRNFDRAADFKRVSL